MPISNRTKLGLLNAILLSVIFGFWLAYTPPDFFRSIFYWIGFVPSAIVGAFFLLPSGPIFPIEGKPRARRNLGYIPVAIAAGALFVASKSFPSALIVEFGIPIALFGGAGLRAFYLLLFQSRWTFCPKCEKMTWILEMNGKWYCKKGHAFETSIPRGPEPKSLPGSATLKM